MSGDTLVFDMATESEGVPSVFVRKDWLSILDNQNGSYQGNQSVIDTSQLANSNKYINYREAYLTVPLLMVLTAPASGTAANAPLFATRPMDQSVGLKNWYGSIVHSFTLDYNGTTIIQQTPYIGLWNSFKLMTSLSWNDVNTMGSQIGFYPDTSESVGKVAYNQTAISQSGTLGTTVNNQLSSAPPFVMSNANTSRSVLSDSPCNLGLQKRQKMWNFNPQQITGSVTGETNVSQAGTFFSGGAAPASSGSQSQGTLTGLTNLWKSYIFSRVDTAAGVQGQICWAITAQIYLKHLHSFFERVPLLKGVFCKMTLNLNQSSVSLDAVGGTGTTTGIGGFGSCTVQSPLGGVSPLMVMSGAEVAVAQNSTSASADTLVINQGMGAQLLNFDTLYTLSIQVGNACLNSTQTGATGAQGMGSPLGRSILLNAPAYSFSPVFEASYLSDPVKKVVYSDVYQYQIVNQISSGGVFNNLITNGIANIKSVLVLPFFSAGTAGVVGTTAATNNGGLVPFQSPFDAAGGGPTSPYIQLNQFNIQISGQNAIYNTERYSYEQWMNQTYGVNAVNGGMTDGLASGLVSQKDFETCYSYYYVNCGRMLPVEEAVPKSVNIIGQNQSAYAIDLYIFVEYGVEIDIDILTGARV
ncbi:MAG: hypothetical protein EBU08_06890 [Micrococcales bacterium]|nr:hypothetical protein [Micrococcales bacterium]